MLWSLQLFWKDNFDMKWQRWLYFTDMFDKKFHILFIFPHFQPKTERAKIWKSAFPVRLCHSTNMLLTWHSLWHECYGRCDGYRKITVTGNGKDVCILPINLSDRKLPPFGLYSGYILTLSVFLRHQIAKNERMCLFLWLIREYVFLRGEYCGKA